MAWKIHATPTNGAGFLEWAIRSSLWGEPKTVELWSGTLPSDWSDGPKRTWKPSGMETRFVCGDADSVGESGIVGAPIMQGIAGERPQNFMRDLAKPTE